MSKLILSLDGGGIRGAASAQFLMRVDAQLKSKFGMRIRDCVDFYAGTSTGAIIAMALATTEMTLPELNRLYAHENAQKIFSENRGWFEFDGINAPRYEGQGKSEALLRHLGNAKVGDVPEGKHVLAVAFDIEKRKPVVVKSTRDKYKSLLSAEVADASSAAPTFFPTTHTDIGGENEEVWLIDGGVTANNPTMCAIAEARRIWRDEGMADLRVLSVGTGYRTRKVNGPHSTQWGVLQWFSAGHILDVLTDERVVAYQAITICSAGKYMRVNGHMKPQPGMPFAPDDAMDDISRKNIKRLKRMGDFWFEKYGESAVALLADCYDGPSLDCIDPASGEPVRY